MVQFGRTKAEQCAKEIIEFLFKHYMWQDTDIYVGDKRLTCYDGKNYHYYLCEDDAENPWECVFEENNINVHSYLDYAGDFLSMSFEGPFYEIINYCLPINYCDDILQEFNEILDKYGYYYELGNAWNLSLYKQ